MNKFPFRILVVDDETDLHLLFKKHFRNEVKEGQLEFQFAGNGAEALQKLKEENSFQIVFTDIKMPVMDGLTLLNHIKELNLDMKVVVISAYDDISNIRTAMNRDAFDFLVKPIALDDLKVTLDKTIREYDNYIKGIEARKKLIEAVKEQEAAILKERLRISRDLHDDVGATLSSISICAESANQHLKNSDVEGTGNLLNRINLDARDMVANMSDMVWLINPGNDKMEKLFDRIRTYATTILSAKNILFISKDESAFNHLSLSIDERKNIYLILKEAINNAAKYAGCTEMKLQIEKHNDKIRFTISDNGKGFDTSPLTPLHERGEHGGNGLENMKERATEISAQLNLTSLIGTGTIIQLDVENKNW